MNRFLKVSMALILMLAVYVPAAQAQATVTTTIAASAMTATDETVNVATLTSTSVAFAVGNFILIDDEVLRITSVPSTGTRVGVQRGQQGTFAATHAANAVIHVGPPDYFIRTDPQGSCTAASETNLPKINSANGTLWSCIGGLWNGTQLKLYTSNLPYRLLTTGNVTATLNDSVIVYTLTGITAAPTVTLPAVTGVHGKVIYVGTSGGVAATTNITVSSSVSQNIGPVASTTSVTISTDTGIMGFLSVNNGWVTIR